MDQSIIDRIENNNPDLFVIVSDNGTWFEVEIFNSNGLFWRKRSFEPDYAQDLQHFLNTHC